MTTLVTSIYTPRTIPRFDRMIAPILMTFEENFDLSGLCSFPSFLFSPNIDTRAYCMTRKEDESPVHRRQRRDDVGMWSSRYILGL